MLFRQIGGDYARELRSVPAQSSQLELYDAPWRYAVRLPLQRPGSSSARVWKNFIVITIGANPFKHADLREERKHTDSDLPIRYFVTQIHSGPFCNIFIPDQE